MEENPEDYVIKNYVTNTSSDIQFFDTDHSDARLSVRDESRSSYLKELGPRWQTDKHVKITKDRYFLICKSCLWCASYFKDKMAFNQCPLCHDGVIECMPIGSDENYRLNYSNDKGLELKFSGTMG
jgi:hypothetical protein